MSPVAMPVRSMLLPSLIVMCAYRDSHLGEKQEHCQGGQPGQHDTEVFFPRDGPTQPQEKVGFCELVNRLTRERER